MIRPILDVERQMTETTVPARMEAEARRQIAIKAMEKEIRNAANAAGSDAWAAAEADAMGRRQRPTSRSHRSRGWSPTTSHPRRRRPALLAEQKGRLAIISAEGGIFDLIAGRYNGNVPTWTCGSKARVAT